MSQTQHERTADFSGQDSLTQSRFARPDDRRRTIESTILALIALAGIWWLRLSIESTTWCVAEVFAILAFALLFVLVSRRRIRLVACVGVICSTPVFAIVARQFGSPIAFEMTAISVLGAGSLALAMYSQTRRNLALSVVASGFLVLFTTLIASEFGTLIPALAWITYCLWHMVANHWERVTACTPDEIRRSTSIRPTTVIVGMLLFFLGGWAIHGRASKPQHFAWGLMPTSGGSRWFDSAARSGIGNGDAAIAAKDHAESFGAVESELFLESTESTLYDMFSDSMGQPKLKQKWERRQGMSPEKLIHAHQRTAKSERGGGSFSTSRDKPQPPQPLRDASERAVVQWIGPTGIRLAMNRYDAFDGVDWLSHASWKNDQLSRVELGDEAWFFDPKQTKKLVKDPERFRHGGVLKVLGLNTTHIPSPMMTAGVYIKDVDRRDFFGIDHDGSLYMPGREKIPALTVMHLAASNVMEDDLLRPTSLADRQSYLSMLSSTRNNADRKQRQIANPTERDLSSGELMAGKLVTELTVEETVPYRKLQSIISYLRNNYTFDRQSVTEGADPLQHFLTAKRGGDHLFATTAAVMGRAIGVNTRLVSGFYVRPSSIDVGQGHASVVPEDVHVWVEVQMDDGRWIELEPTPGYRQPVYKPSGWLLAKRFAVAHWVHALAVIVIGTLFFLTRVIFFELFIRLAWLLGGLLSDRQRLRVLLWILQWRASLAGKPRRVGTPQRDWLLSLTHRDDKLSGVALACCDAADRMVFGEQVADDWSAPANLLVRQMTTRHIYQGMSAETSQPGVHV
ncbi:MAG: DUF3488 and transglutaminase-like domain-containing protein [Rubripirellula sp.]